MIEKFTEEEIEQIKKELEQLELDKQDKLRPGSTQEYKDAISKLFKDRPYHEKGYCNRPDIPIYCARAIDTIISMTLDCTEIKDVERRDQGRDQVYVSHEMHVRKLQKLPPDIADEYYEMFDEILDLMRGHLKPYKRFVEEGQA